MKRTLFHTSLAACLGAQLMLADFSYEQKSQITGGMMTKLAFMSKQIREPQVSTVMVKGNRMAHASEGRVSVIDVDKETITDIDMKGKSYSVMTFEQMKQMIEDAQKKMSGKAETTFDLDVKETGETKTIQGFNCKEFVVTMKMITTDAKSGKSAEMLMTSHMWNTTGVPGMTETREFYMKMGQKMAGFMPGGGGMGMMNRPDMQRAMAKMQEDGMKMEGMSILQTVSTTMTGEAGDAMRQAGQARAEGESQRVQQPQQPKPSVEGAAAEAIAGRLGRLGGIGGLGRKKKPDSTDNSPQPPAQAAPPTRPAPEDNGSMMEMQIEHGRFSTSPVDASKFEIPAGFKQVERKR